MPARDPARLIAVTVATGVAAGLAGGVLTLFLHLVQHLAFGYTENTFGVGVARASRARRVVVLVLAGAVAGFGWWALRRRTGPVVRVEQAVHDGGTAPLPVVTADAALQVAVVGLGASLGREGAPRQLGGALAAWLARRAGLSADQRRILVACGAAAGLAAVYNVPFGGAVFAAEVLLRSAAPRVLVSALAVSWIATVTSWTMLPDRPTYAVPHLSLTGSLVVFAVVAGPVFGLVGAAFARVTDRVMRHVPHGWRLPLVAVPVFAALGGVATAYPQVLGNGKGPAEQAFTGGAGLATFAALSVLKPLATTALLAAGAVGGRLTPAVATGAVLGAFLGGEWLRAWPGGASGAFAVVGGCAVLAVSLRAPLCAVVLMLEFVHTDLALLPAMVLAVAGAMLVDRLLPADPVARAEQPPGPASSSCGS